MVRERQPDSISRRRVLVWIAAGVGIAIGSWRLRPRTVANEWLDVAHRLRLDELDVHALGKAYLAEHPGDASAETLRAQLPPPSSYAAHQRARQSDFESGRLVVVDGWIVSRTEARIAALIVQRAR